MITGIVYELIYRVGWAAVLSLPICFVALFMCRFDAIHPGVKVWILRLAGIKIFADLFVGTAWGVTVLPAGAIEPGTRLGYSAPVPHLIPALLVSAWAYWVGYRLVQLGRSAWEAHQITQCAHPARIYHRLDNSARIEFSSQLTCPAAVGLLRPRILFPATETQIDATELAHESAHIRHGDLWAQLGMAMLAAALGFLPWVARLEREMALWQEAWADNSARKATGAPGSEHAERILRRMSQTSPAWSASMSGTKSGAARRLKALFVPKHSFWAAMAALLFVGLLTVPLKAAPPVVEENATVVAPVRMMAGG